MVIFTVIYQKLIFVEDVAFAGAVRPLPQKFVALSMGKRPTDYRKETIGNILRTFIKINA
ncbi:MAG: hypothetical protein DWB56_00295 [Candidatus Jettenia sp.]|uniref:Uncharacterized protein n=1 Tax=Candidatus Jettenia caeni TaxID=247490 RepID=I3ILI8_9BACT|nr:MAG: hypothetical protein EDM77_00295 [Candidatus Jettenia sp. AMX1]MBC6927393.1 hypothetical protein [Candidatus Jettenia sp.]MCE7879076.1 hypothetical protein [Candidatus Jettenia sp. AMX1]MCQ3925822.1 hypothetical protein [Candidatus Jettenia sp.]GAB62583.1 hypothetical protein KSU1_C0987 [Candidatus Jettenia caeni]